MPGMMSATCLSSGTDLAMKTCAMFSKSIITTGVMSPSVSTGAFALVASTVARVIIVVFDGIYVSDSLSEELNESVNGGGDEGGRSWDSWWLLLTCEVGAKLSRIGSCCKMAVVQVN